MLGTRALLWRLPGPPAPPPAPPPPARPRGGGGGPASGSARSTQPRPPAPPVRPAPAGGRAGGGAAPADTPGKVKSEDSKSQSSTRTKGQLDENPTLECPQVFKSIKFLQIPFQNLKKNILCIPIYAACKVCTQRE